MFTRNVSMDLEPTTFRESAYMFDAGRQIKGGVGQYRAFIRECWQGMCQMRSEFNRENVKPTAAA